jgi:hypothetical protein
MAYKAKGIREKTAHLPTTYNLRILVPATEHGYFIAS